MFYIYAMMSFLEKVTMYVLYSFLLIHFENQSNNFKFEKKVLVHVIALSDMIRLFMQCDCDTATPRLT